jgi:hypothetical protein
MMVGASACSRSLTSTLAGTVNLLDHRRNESLNRARHADSYAIPATLVTSAQI